MRVLEIFPLLFFLASALAARDDNRSDRNVQNIFDIFAGKVSDFANKIFSTLSGVHESFSKPSSSLPTYNNSVYEQQGQVINLGSYLNIYTVGEGPDTVIWNYNIEGFNGGRTRERCDQLASKGFKVIMPDYYHGEEAKICSGADFFCWMSLNPFIVAKNNWTRLEADWNLVRSWAEENGATRFATVGTCGGTYMTLRMSSLPEIIAGVTIHPSHSTMIPNLGEDEATILGQVTAPQLILPTKTDSDNVQPGGLDETILREQGVEVIVEPFSAMNHGFFTRGHMEDPEIEAEVARAMNLTVAFLNKHFGK